MNTQELFDFLSEKETGKPRVAELTIEDVKNNIEVGVYSGFGGMHLHPIKLEGIPEWMEKCGRRINRDFYIVKYQAIDVSLLAKYYEPEECNTVSENIIFDIIRDLTDRRGIKHEWNQIDDDIKEEILHKWVGIVNKRLGEEAR